VQSIPDLRHGRRKARIGLRGYIFCCLGLVAALPVLVLGVIQVSKWEAKQLDDVDQERQFVAQTLVQGIGQIVDGHVRAVETLAGQVEARGSLDKAVLQPMVGSLRARYGGFSVMYIAGADAVSIVTDPPFNEDGKPNAGTNYSGRDYYRAMRRTGGTAISRVQIGKRSGVPNVQIAAPVRDEQGGLVGFVEGSLDLDSIQQLVDSTIKGMPGLQVAVLDHAGRVIAYPDAKLRQAVATLSQLALFKKYTGSGIEIRTGEDDKGVAMRASVTAVTAHGLDWNVVVYRPQVYELSQAATARTQVLTVAAIALLAGLIVATFLAEGLARPIRKLANIVTAVSKGDLSQMPDPPHALTPREMAALQIDVRHMVGQLKDYTTDMESKIEERTEQVREANRELESFLYSNTH
jgi:HAMP domain-containing protein